MFLEKTWIFLNFTTPSISTYQEVAATSISSVDREGEPDNRGCDRFIQGSFTLRLVKYVIEDEQRLVVASVHNRTDLDSQADCGCATFH